MTDIRLSIDDARTIALAAGFAPSDVHRASPHALQALLANYAANAAQGETVRLFEPAPAQMPGQLGWPDDAAPVDHVDNDGYAIHDA